MITRLQTRPAHHTTRTPHAESVLNTPSTQSFSLFHSVALIQPEHLVYTNSVKKYTIKQTDCLFYWSISSGICCFIKNTLPWTFVLADPTGPCAQLSFRGAQILFHSNVKTMVYVLNIVARKRPIGSCLIYWNNKKRGSTIKSPLPFLAATTSYFLYSW